MSLIEFKDQKYYNILGGVYIILIDIDLLTDTNEIYTFRMYRKVSY